MNRVHAFFIPATGTVSVGLCSIALLLGSPPASAACPLPTLDSPLAQQQVLDKATQGLAPLKHYVYRTRMIHQLDLVQTVKWLDDRRAAEAACALRAAGVDAVASSK